MIVTQEMAPFNACQTRMIELNQNVLSHTGLCVSVWDCNPPLNNVQSGHSLTLQIDWLTVGPKCLMSVTVSVPGHKNHHPTIKDVMNDIEHLNFKFKDGVDLEKIDIKT